MTKKTIFFRLTRIKTFLKIITITFLLVIIIFSLNDFMDSNQRFYNNDDFSILHHSSGFEMSIDEIWESTSNDEGNGIALDISGNIYITGFTYNSRRDVLVVKYDSSGTLLWDRTWGTSGDDEGRDVAIDSSGNVFITGFVFDIGDQNSNVFLLKYDSSGNLLWNKIWGGSNSDFGYGIALDVSGNVFITGVTKSYGAGSDDIFLLKYDSSGTLLWDRTWGGSDSDRSYGITLDSLGNVLITGVTQSYGEGSSDVVLLKYDSSGNLLWETMWGDITGNGGYGITLDNSGNIYITGYTWGTESIDVLLLKLDSYGNLLWNKTWGGSDYEEGFGISLDSSGNILITGFTDSYGAGFSDVLLLKFDSFGNIKWYKTCGTPSPDEGRGIVLDQSDNIFITGMVKDEPRLNNDLFLLKDEVDGDNDGLSDLSEENTYLTDPNNIDSDGDGFNDGEEILNETDPLSAFSNPFISAMIPVVVIVVIVIVVLVIAMFLLMSQIKKRKERRKIEREDAEKRDIAERVRLEKELGALGKDILVFVSYATKDAEIFKIKEISQELSSFEKIKNVLYWQEDMKDNIIKYMNDNLGNCDVMLLFCSQNALKSEPVEKEWTAADIMGKPIIPVFLSPIYIPPLLKSRLGIEFDTYDLKKNVNEIYKLILKKIKSK